MTDIKKLKDKIVEANEAYRFGDAIMTDIEYDALLEQLKTLADEEEYSTFVDSLNEKSDASNKVKHEFVCGSLNKIKYDEPKIVRNFLESYCKSKLLSVSAKLDGLSGIACYRNGKLVSFSTRGDGYEGEDILNKAPYVKGLLQEIDIQDNIDVRGELVIKRQDFEKLCEVKSFSNPRNAVAGIMNTKDDVSCIPYVSFVAYTVLGDEYTKQEQFKILEKLGFEVAWNIEVDPKQEDIVEKLFNYANTYFEMETDGLVLSAIDYKNEDTYRPKAQVAFKTNLQKFETRLIDVDFSNVSKDGFITPIGILEPVEVGGVVVSKCTLHNLDFLEEKGLKIGSKVYICRSGDVIPKLLSVIESDSNCVDIELPKTCPCCGSKLERDGINMRCFNKDCLDQKILQIMFFIKKLGIKYCNAASLKSFNITSFDELLAFRPDKKYKTQTRFYSELVDKMFSKSKQELLAAMNFCGVGETNINKIVDFYGYDNIVNDNYIGYPSGIGELTLQKFKDDIQNNLKIVDSIIIDSRYNYLESSNIASGKIQTKDNGMSVCFTGKLETMTRNEASAKAEEHGFKVLGGVKKGLTYLVTNNPDTTSTKGKKAKELGIKMISEAEFLDMCNTSMLQADISSL